MNAPLALGFFVSGMMPSVVPAAPSMFDEYKSPYVGGQHEKKFKEDICMCGHVSQQEIFLGQTNSKNVVPGDQSVRQDIKATQAKVVVDHKEAYTPVVAKVIGGGLNVSIEERCLREGKEALKRVALNQHQAV
jgi:hypothetical protein